MLKAEYLAILSLKLDLKLLNENDLQSAVETSFSDSNDEKNVFNYKPFLFHQLF
jgi:hypothetical protein